MIFPFGDRTSRVIIVHPNRPLPLARGSEDPTIYVRRIEFPSGRFPFLLPTTRKPARAPSSRNIAHGHAEQDNDQRGRCAGVRIALKDRSTSIASVQLPSSILSLLPLTRRTALELPSSPIPTTFPFSCFNVSLGRCAWCRDAPPGRTIGPNFGWLPSDISNPEADSSRGCSIQHWLLPMTTCRTDLGPAHRTEARICGAHPSASLDQTRLPLDPS